VPLARTGIRVFSASPLAIPIAARLSKKSRAGVSAEENFGLDPAAVPQSLSCSLPLLAMSERRCPRCEQTRPEDDFAGDASKASGRKSICKPCDNEKSRRYYEANRDRVIARVQAQQAAKRATPHLKQRRSGRPGGW
jgi:hypothetical protein